MSFLVVDNKRLELDSLTAILKTVRPEIRVFSIPSAEDVLDMSSLDFDAAFIDIELDAGRMNGLELAARLKSVHKDTHIIFVTKSRKYFREAFSVHADAYLLKKVSEDDVRRELNYLTNYYPAPLKVSGKIYMRTFGGFSVFLDGKMIEFNRSRAKELLALLIDRRGIPVTAREACAVLFGDRPYDESCNGYYHVIVNSLARTLEKVGMEKILVKSKKYIAVDPDTFECDAYRFLRGDPSAIRQYRGDYLNCYSWAEFSSKIFETPVGGGITYNAQF